MAKEKKICVIGLGYVGLPLAVAFAKQYKVVGFDINEDRVSEIKKNEDHTLEVTTKELKDVSHNICYSTSIEEASNCNIFIVTVPTPIDEDNRPNLSPLISSSQAVGSVLSKGDIVVYESTVYPGVTEEICVPELEKASKLKFNQDFYCGYSPERVNPGDKEHTVTKILKVTSGSTPEVAKKIDDLYNTIIAAGTHLAPSIKVAEAAKVIENTQRDVNIALINELALIFNQMGINTHDVIAAAATKWNFIKLNPGLVGGHCIGVDPYYLTFKAEELGYTPNLILASRQINNSMSKHVADETIKQMIQADKQVKGADVLILGMAFKEDCPDMRNTKVIDIISELKSFGVNVDVFDPWVNTNIDIPEKYAEHLISNPLKGCNATYDAIVVAVGHTQFKSYSKQDFQLLSKGRPIIMDVKNIIDDASWKL